MKHPIDVLTPNSLANIVKLFYSNKVKFQLLSLELSFKGLVLLENSQFTFWYFSCPKTGFSQLCTSYTWKYANEILKINNYVMLHVDYLT